MTEFMDEFMHEMSVAFPKLLVQFEVDSSRGGFRVVVVDLSCDRTSPLTMLSCTSSGTVTSILSLTMTSRAPVLSFSVVL